MISEKAYNTLKSLVVSRIQLEIDLGQDIKLDGIDKYINDVLKSMPPQFELDNEIRDKLFRDIEYQFNIKHEGEACIYNDYEEARDWYEKLDNRNDFFWQRYRTYLINNTGIDIRSINLLDEETLPNILNCLGDPNDEFEGKRLRRGLIIGDVQSGKTATYSGLICKAADAGYKVVILLAGITENLRQQTQERIDEGIVGTTITKIGKVEKPHRVGVGLDNKPIKAASFTSATHDFVDKCDKIAFSLDQQKSLVLFVVKKNVSVLTKLFNWLRDMNVDPVLQCVNIPMLLVDDEADNASVNTRNEETDPTRTNKIIRDICNLFKNATYVGFTATPFANVFIDPDSVDAMNHADLFPEHFIYSLPTPSNYIGATRLFYEDGANFDNLRYISDIEEPDYSSDEYKELVSENIEELNQGTFYYKHKKEWHGILPQSLRESILCFFLANVIYDLRGNISSPRSMLINMSRFIKVQNYISEYVEEVYNAFFSTIRYNFDVLEKNNKDLPLYEELKTLWEKHFTHISDIPFSKVIDKNNLISAIDKIKVVVVNGSKSNGRLDYKENKSLRVIAIGGLALSRGLTLEGLLVSYFYRNTATFDVLMQMGRWFGYRPNYEDLFQVWTSPTSAAWYEEIAKASEALKLDIKEMCDQHLTPKDFGIKVRDNSVELRITAANKMRASYDLTVPYTYAGNIYDTPYISLNAKRNQTNWEAVASLATMLTAKYGKMKFADVGRHPQSEIDNPTYGESRFFVDVDQSDVIEFLRSIKCSSVNMNFNVDNILKFIAGAYHDDSQKWDVVFEGGDSKEKYDIPELATINCTARAIYGTNKNVIQISSRRRLLGLREGKFTLTKEQLEQAESSCREAWIAEGYSVKSAKNRDVPLKAYFQYLPERKPILIIMLLQPKEPDDCKTKEDSPSLKKFREELGSGKIVAFAIGFPGSEEVGDSQKFKVNKYYYRNFIEDSDESEDDE